MNKQLFKNYSTRKERIAAVRINPGSRCNQSCLHCGQQGDFASHALPLS